MLKVEKTSVDTILKFVSNSILTEGSFEYNNVDEAKNSNLVQQLFYLPFVKKVFVSANFIAIERFKIVEWNEVATELNQMISLYIDTHGSIFNQEKKETQVALQVFTESTPNPNVNKFVANKMLTRQLIELNKNDDASQVPLAKELFKFDYVDEIFISENYVSIVKNKDFDWMEIIPELRGFIRVYLQEGKEIVTDKYLSKTVQVQESLNAKNSSKESSISKEIIAVLDEYIKPAVTADGGNIMFKSYDEETKTCSVVLQGACSGCPSATITLKNGIEATLKQVLPNKIDSVVAING
jgi:Fe-S cluster biogenesis protein NfuA